MRTLLVALMVSVGLAASATGQTFDWNNALGGMWTGASNWVQPGFPNGASSTANINLSGAYSVIVGSTITVGTLNIGNPSATLEIDNANTLSIAAAAAGAGRIVVNPTAGGNNTAILFPNPITLSIADLRLNASGNQLDRAYLQPAVGAATNAAGGLIHGTGNMYGTWINDGEIRADQAGLILQLATNSPRTNNNLFKAVNAGILYFNSGTMTQGPNGRIIADGTGSTVTMAGGTYTGGTAESLNGGLINLLGTVTWTNVQPIGPLVIPNASALIITSPGLTHNDTLSINPTGGGNTTFLRFDAAGTLAGNGTLVLNATGNQLDRAHANANNVTITHGASRLLHGTGNMYGTWINDGEIRADQAGLILQLATNSPRTNNNLFKAVNAGILYFNSGTMTQGPNGRIIADGTGSTVTMAGGTYTGGTAESLNGGLINLLGTVAWNNVQPIGPLVIPNASALIITSPGLTHNDTLSINPTGGGNTTFLRFDAAGTLAGNGTLVLNATGNQLDRAHVNANNVTITHGASRLIHGTGNMYGTWINDGEIRADQAGLILQLATNSPRTNNNLFKAVNAGILYFNSGTMTQGPNGRIIADGTGSTVTMAGGTYTGGTAESLNGGLINLLGTVTWTNVQPIGPLVIPNASALIITSPGLTHNDTLSINPTGGGNTTFLRFDAAGTLAGNGTLVLNATGNQLDRAHVNANNVTITHGANRLLRGTGNMYGTWINDGEIRADQAGLILQLATNSPRTNNNLYKAVNAGILYFNSGTMTQGPNGRIIADGPGSTVTMAGGTYTGGTAESLNGGLINLLGTVAWNNVQPIGPLVIPNASALIITSPGLTHNDTLSINPTGGGNTTFLRFDAAGTLAGNGTLVLNASDGQYDRAYIQNNNASSLTLGPGRTLRGNGNIYGTIINQGTLDPGLSAGALQFINRLTMEPTTSLNIEIAGIAPSQYDRIIGGGRKDVAGVVNVSYLGGYTPAAHDQLSIVTGSPVTGAFSGLVAPLISDALEWRLRYPTNEVRLVVACRADLNDDDTLDFNDYLEFLNAFNAQDPRVDLNRDGVVDFNDYLEFLNLYNSPC